MTDRADRQRREQRLQRVATFTLFVVALVYGFAIVAALSNTIVLVASLAQGQSTAGNLPIALLGWGVILLVHKRRGWPPFSRRR